MFSISWAVNFLSKRFCVPKSRILAFLRFKSSPTSLSKASIFQLFEFKARNGVLVSKAMQAVWNLPVTTFSAMPNAFIYSLKLFATFWFLYPTKASGPKHMADNHRSLAFVVSGVIETLNLGIVKGQMRK